MTDKAVVTVGALLVNDAGQILFGLRASWKKAWPDHWDSIGGRLEPGETLDEAMVREVREESGVTPTEFQWLECVPERRPELYGEAMHHIYAVTDWEGGMPSNRCDEHAEIRWFTLDELSLLPNLADSDYLRLGSLAVQRKTGLAANSRR